MKKLLEIVQKKPYLAWYVKDTSRLSPKSIMEHVFNFGDWNDYLEAEEALGIQKAKEIFEQLTSKKRVNLRRKTINYFQKYYQKYA